MNTIFIYDTLGEYPVQFFVKEGDYRHLNGLYVKDVDLYAEDEKTHHDAELSDLIGYAELLDSFPCHMMGSNTAVIVVGYIF